MTLALRDRVYIDNTGTTYDGKRGEVIYVLGSGRYLVAVDGHTSSTGLRMYTETNVKLVPWTPVPVPPVGVYKFNNLVFEDNFDMLLSAWSLYEGPGHAGNGVRLRKCWSIQSGVPGANGNCMVGRAEWDSELGKNRTPGMSHNYDSVAHRMEVRMRTDKDPSGITASNFLTWPKDQVHGEVNVWETTGTGNPERTPMHSYVHYGNAGALLQVPFSHALGGDTWHDVMYERTPDYLKIWVDGVQLVNFTDKEKINGFAMYPHHLCLQLDALRQDRIPTPVELQVDRVRIWA